MIKVLKIDAGDRPQVVWMNSSLRSLQKAVGGTIQALYPQEDEVAVICDDEGKLKGYPLNRVLADEENTIYDILCGTFLIVGLTEEGFGSLSEKFINKYMKKFYKPEFFIRTKDGHMFMMKGDDDIVVIY